jgi:LuxR family maltose regulon positive regulatory protein
MGAGCSPTVPSSSLLSSRTTSCAALGGRLVAVVAPAGAGKTSLVADFARALERPVCWLNAEPRFTDPVELVQALARAAEPIAPAAPVRWSRRCSRRRTRSRCRATASRRWCGGWRRGAAVCWCWTTPTISRASGGRCALDALIERLPAGWTQLVAGRCLPEVSGAEAAARLGWEELALTAAETGALLAALRGEAVTEATAARCWRETGGWAAALVAGGDTEKVRPAVAEGPQPQTAQAQFDQLARDLLARMDPTERHLLMRAAVPRTLDAETYALVTTFEPEGRLPLDPEAELPCFR